MAKEGSFTTDAVRLTVSKVLGNLLTLVSAMLLARIRTLEENGIYSALLLVINLAASIFMLGLPNCINYFLAKAESQEDKNRFLSLYYTFSTILCFILGLVLFLLIPVWSDYFNNEKLSLYWFFFLIFPWAKIITASVENVLVVLGKSSTLVKYRISNSILLLFIIFVIWVFKSSFMVYMILYVVVEGGYALSVYFLASKYTGKLHLNLDRIMIRRVLAFSIPLGLASIVGTLNIEIDKLMLGHLLSTSELAIYTNASKELPLTIVATSLTAVLMPKMVQLFSKQENEAAVAIWRDVTAISFAIMAFFAFGMATFSTEAMIILYSDKYAPGGPVFAIYSLGLLLKCTYFGMSLNSNGKTKLILYCAIGTLVLNTLLNVLLYFMLGIIGPAIATVLSQMLMNIFQLMLTSKVLRVPFKSIFPWKYAGFLIVVNLIFSICFILFHRFIFPGNWQAVILALVWGVLYFAVLYKPGKKMWNHLKEV